MSFNKSVSVLMIASQLGLVSLASGASGASAAVPAAVSPEFKMLQSVLALQGQSLSSDQSQKQLSSLVTNYLSQVSAQAPASQAGQQERMQKALVDLGVYNDAQAAAFVADSQKGAVAAESSSDVNGAMAAEISRLASVHPAGAQFSACALGDSLGVPVAIAGMLVLTVGAVLRYDNPTCSAPVIGETVYSNGQSATTYGPTTCTNPDYYPHEAAGNATLYAGGVLTLVGALAFILTFSPAC